MTTSLPVPTDAGPSTRSLSTRTAAADRRRIIDTLLANLSAGRIDECMTAFTEDIVMSVPFVPAGMTRRCQGKEELAALLQWAARRFSPFDLEAMGGWELAPDGYAAQYRAEGVYLPSGRPYRNSYLGLFFMEDSGLIREWTEYCSPIPMLFATGR